MSEPICGAWIEDAFLTHARAAHLCVLAPSHEGDHECSCGATWSEPCPYRAHYGEPCDCEARLAAVVTHTRASTPVGPDYCRECSEAVSEWMPWPCPATRPTPAPTEES